MTRIFKFNICVLLLFFACILLTSCSRVVVNSADELTMHKWEREFENGTKITLSFSLDDATLRVKTNDGEDCVLSGLCEINSSVFVIYDKDTGMHYTFEYIVHFDSVDLVYEGNTVSLYKT